VLLLVSVAQGVASSDVDSGRCIDDKNTRQCLTACVRDCDRRTHTVKDFHK
jgi:hypothetical protein